MTSCADDWKGVWIGRMDRGGMEGKEMEGWWGS